MTAVMMSSAIGPERLPFGLERSPRSPERQRWLSLARAYGDGLRACGYQTVELMRPEIYQTKAAHQLLGLSPGDWHLAIKPIAHLRPFHGLPNVFLCDEPPAPSRDGVPPEDVTLWPAGVAASPKRAFEDELAVLGKADAVLCCSSHSAGLLTAAGLHRVFVLPPYIASTAPPVDPQARTRPELIFLAVVDGADLESPSGKLQFDDLVSGFAQARGQDGQLRLNILLRRGANSSSVMPAVSVGGVTVVDEDEGSFARLAGNADFYVSNHAHAGLSVPVLEATRAGLACVTRVSAEMAEFLPEGSCIPILAEGAVGVADAILCAASADLKITGREMQALNGERLGKRAFAAGLSEMMKHIAR